MDNVTLNDQPAWDKDQLSVQQVNDCQRAVGKLVPGVPTDTTIIIAALGVDAGLTGPQLAAIKSSIEAIAGVNAVRPVVRMVSPVEDDLPFGTEIALAVSGQFRYSQAAE
jgi:hypothetical protein